MEIDYDFYSNPLPNSRKETESSYHVRLVEHQTINLKELAKVINARCTVSEADIVGTLSALSGVLAEQLVDGNRVHLDGLGYFSLSVKAEVNRDDKGELQIGNARVETINFKPEKSLMGEVSQVKLTRKRHLGQYSAQISEEDIKQRVKTFCAEKGVMQGRDFRNITGLASSTASRRLAKLVKDGLLENTNTARFPLYKYIGE